MGVGEHDLVVRQHKLRVKDPKSGEFGVRMSCKAGLLMVSGSGLEERSKCEVQAE